MMKKYTRLDCAAIFAILVISSILVLSYWVNKIQITAVIGTVIAVIALILYIIDRIIVEPAILQTFIDRTPKVNEYIIRAFISNEGARKAHDCEVVAIGGDNDVILDHVPIDSLKGRIGVDWPANKKYALYPRRPIWVRGYITAEPNTQIAIVLRWKGKVYSRLSFTLPDPSDC